MILWENHMVNGFNEWISTVLSESSGLYFHSDYITLFSYSTIILYKYRMGNSTAKSEGVSREEYYRMIKMISDDQIIREKHISFFEEMKVEGQTQQNKSLQINVLRSILELLTS